MQDKVIIRMGTIHNRRSVRLAMVLAATIILCLAGPTALPRLLSAIAGAQTYVSKNPDVKMKEAEEERINDLLKNVVSNDDEDSEKAFRLLKKELGGEPLSLWLTLLEKAKLPRIKKDLIEHITTIRDKSAIVPLAKELSSPYGEVRKSAALALKDYYDDRIYPYILALSTSQNPVYRIYFIEAMNHLYDRRFYELMVNLLKDPNKSVRIYTINCLQSNNLTDSIPLIRNIAMTDGNDEVKVAAIDAMGHFQDRAGLYVLLKTINEPGRDVRLATARTLRALAMGNAALPLSQRLMVETDDAVKDMIIEALIKVKNAGNIGGLSRILLQDASEDLRVKSAYALGVVKDQKAVPLLLQGMADKSRKVRAETANSLGMYKTPDSIHMLLDTVEKDGDIYVRSAALYSLKRINDRKTAMPLFDIYAREKDPLFRELMRMVIREFMNKYL